MKDRFATHEEPEHIQRLKGNDWFTDSKRFNQLVKTLPFEKWKMVNIEEFQGQFGLSDCDVADLKENTYYVFEDTIQGYWWVSLEDAIYWLSRYIKRKPDTEGTVEYGDKMISEFPKRKEE